MTFMKRLLVLASILVMQCALVHTATDELMTFPPTYVYRNGTPQNCNTGYGHSQPVYCTAPGEWPLGSFRPPAQGGTYYDANFGTRIRVLSDPSRDALHWYSSPSALSATGKYAIFYDVNQVRYIVETASGKVVRSKWAYIGTWGQGYAYWSAEDDDTLYFLPANPARTDYSGTEIRRYSVSTDTYRSIIDYGNAPYSFHAIETGGTGDVSKDDWLSFWVSEKKLLCAVDLRSARTICSSYIGGSPDNSLPLNDDDIDFTLISKGRDSTTGKRYIVMVAYPASAVFQVDEFAGRLDFVVRPEYSDETSGSRAGNHDGRCVVGEQCIATTHSDTGEDALGRQYWVMPMNWEPTHQQRVVALHLASGAQMTVPNSRGGGLKQLMSLTVEGDRWTDYHVGCAKTSPYCLIDTERQQNNPSVSLRGPRETYSDEIIVLGLTDRTVQRVAAHRSVLWEYYDQPRASIAGDASQVLWDTNFGTQSLRRVVAADTGIRGPGRICEPYYATDGSWFPAAGGGFALSGILPAWCSAIGPTTTTSDWLTIRPYNSLVSTSVPTFGPVILSTLTANYGSYREATIRTGAATIVVRQPSLPPPCKPFFPASESWFPIAGGSFGIPVSAGSGCSWTVTSDVPWVTVTSPSGVGSGAVTIRIASRDVSYREGSLKLTNSTFRVRQ